MGLKEKKIQTKVRLVGCWLLRERGRQTEGAQGKEEHFGRCAGEGRSTEIMQKEKMHANRFLVNSGREG